MRTGERNAEASPLAAPRHLPSVFPEPSLCDFVRDIALCTTVGVRQSLVVWYVRFECRDYRLFFVGLMVAAACPRSSYRIPKNERSSRT